MPTYDYKVDNEPVPGASTIAGYYMPKEARERLLGWVKRETLAGRDHKETLEEAGNIGTEVHAMVEAKMKGRPVTCSLPITMAPRAWAAFGAYEKWAAPFSIEVIAQESPLTSKLYRFGGTPDLIGAVDGEIRLFDWKTSNGVYESHGMQAAAYVVLWNENNPAQKITGGAHIVAFTKTGGLKRSRLSMDDLGHLWVQFLGALMMWKRQNQINEIMTRSLKDA